MTIKFKVNKMVQVDEEIEIPNPYYFHMHEFGSIARLTDFCCISIREYDETNVLILHDKFNPSESWENFNRNEHINCDQDKQEELAAKFEPIFAKIMSAIS